MRQFVNDETICQWLDNLSMIRQFVNDMTICQWWDGYKDIKKQDTNIYNTNIKT